MEVKLLTSNSSIREMECIAANESNHTTARLTLECRDIEDEDVLGHIYLTFRLKDIPDTLLEGLKMRTVYTCIDSTEIIASENALIWHDLIFDATSTKADRKAGLAILAAVPDEFKYLLGDCVHEGIQA